MKYKLWDVERSLTSFFLPMKRVRPQYTKSPAVFHTAN